MPTPMPLYPSSTVPRRGRELRRGRVCWRRVLGEGALGGRREVANPRDFRRACDLELEVGCHRGHAERALRLEGRDEAVEIARPMHWRDSRRAALRDNGRDFSHAR